MLLQLKKELIFNSSISTKLVQWNQSDEWQGVECDAAGNVVGLHLGHEAISGGIEDSSSLFRFKYLQKLNLAYNDFPYTPIPKGINNLTYLTHLNLSYAGFSGQLPPEILSLKRLASLDISSAFSLILEQPNFEMLLRNLTGLRELYLDGTDIVSSHEKTKWSHIISSHSPNITRLSMRFCSLSGPLAKSFWQLRSLSVLRLDNNDLSTVVPDSFASFPSLTTLSLVGCELNSSFYSKIFHMPVLENLDLSYNLLSGSIGPFPQTGSLLSIVLVSNNFSGLLPSSISNLRTLSKLDVSHCKFSGSIPSAFANLTELVYVDLQYNFFTGSLSTTLFEGLSNLVYLQLNSNSFSGHIPHSLFGLASLSRLHLKDNQFIGLVEEFRVVNVSSVVLLDLRSNRLEGPIPNSWFELRNLEFLLLSGNMFNGSVQLDKILSLANLTNLDLSGNNLSIDGANDNSSTYGHSRIRELSLGSCNLHGFPEFIKHSDIRKLGLSSNSIAGEIPSWIWGKQLELLDLSLNLLTGLQTPYHIPSSLHTLDLNSNQFKGDLNLLVPPNATSNLQILLLGNNSFSGSIPTSLCKVSSLNAVDLSSNNLSGRIPPCLIEKVLELDLGRNNLSGSIPDHFPLNCLLSYLDLNDNSLQGTIPKSLESCQSLGLLNVGNNMINDTFPCMLPPSLHVLVLHNNIFHGEVRCHRDWPELQILDISSNNFSQRLESVNFTSWTRMAQLRGEDLSFYTSGVILTTKGIPREYGGIWSDFGTLDFSSNHFRGLIPDAVGELVSLHNLNFSHNSLNGSIPRTFGELGKLESLDLSGNRLSGPIPGELGGLTFLSFLNLSYNDLAGQIPNGRQLQTFSSDSFRGNPKLCGFNINITCIPRDRGDSSPTEDEDVGEKREIEWKYVFAALGFVVGVGIVVWLLLFCRSFREKYFNKIDGVFEEVFDAINKRRHVKT